MSTYRITIDRQLCSGFGACVELAPDLFRLADDGVASAIVVETDNRSALDAADSCPMGAIIVEEVKAA